MGPVVFVSMARIFQVSGGVKVPLQVQIHLKMPQIVMLFVQDFVDQFLVQVAVLVDSCAALNTMYLPFGIYLCKKYPWIVSAVYGPKRHHSIHLTGIVKEDENAISTELPVAFVFVTPFRTTAGDPINVAIAAGNVNYGITLFRN